MSESKQTNLKCPKCGGRIVEKEKLFSCGNNAWDAETKKAVGCDFVVWKQFFGQEITVDDLKTLRERPDNVVFKDGMRGKSGKEFEGFIWLNPVTLKLELGFEDRETGDIKFPNHSKPYAKT